MSPFCSLIFRVIALTALMDFWNFFKLNEICKTNNWNIIYTIKLRVEKQNYVKYMY